jgi:carbohydrate diacid regulator
MSSASPSAGPSTVLNPELAQEIAGETSAIIGLNIIITDADGIVIGSGDRARVGTFHEASLEVIATQRSTAHNAEEAAALVGVRPGMTLPIVHRGVGVGTVGITGTPAEARRFGQVVKRQTEILLDESVLLRSRMTRERVLETLLRDLLNYDVDHLRDITTRARDFGFDLSLPRQAVLVEVAGAEQPEDSPVSSSALRLIRELFHNPQDISASLSSVSHIVLRRYGEGAEAVGGDDLADLAARIHAQVGRSVRIGIGGVARSVEAIPASHAEARAALRIGVESGRSSPYDIDDLRVEQLVTALPGRLRSRVTDDIIGSLRSSNDWATTRATVIAWVESGFVLVEAARALNVHRNTLVYRLRRITAETGWPTNDRRRWLALYLACVSDGLTG